MMRVMVRREIKSLIGMGGLPVHSCFRAPILVYRDTGVKKK